MRSAVSLIGVSCVEREACSRVIFCFDVLRCLGPDLPFYCPEAGESHDLFVLPGMAAGVVLLVIFWCPEVGVSVYLLPGATTSYLAF